MKPRVAILISGRGSNMEALIRAAAAQDYPAHIALVVSNKADAPGLATAAQLGVKTLAIPAKPHGRDRAAHEREIDTALRAENIHIVCLAGYMRLLTPYLVGAWAGRMLNIHPSLLPKYPGLETHARVLQAGEPTHGCTVHLVTEEMDAGPVLAQAEVPVLAGEPEAALAARVLAAEHRLYPAALAAFAQKLALPEGPGEP